MRSLLTWLYLIGCLGCGYTPLRSGEAFGAHRILVMAPREAEPTGIAGPYVDELRRRLVAEGFTLARNGASADAELRSEVLASSTSPLSTVPGARLSAFTVRVSLETEMRAPDGSVLWSTRVSESEDFFPDDQDESGLTSEEILATDSNERRRALTRLTERLAERVVRRIQRASL